MSLDYKVDWYQILVIIRLQSPMIWLSPSFLKCYISSFKYSPLKYDLFHIYFCKNNYLKIIIIIPSIDVFFTNIFLQILDIFLYYLKSIGYL